MKILVLGVRGIPNVQGGVETHAEQLYPRLSALGCDIEVIVRTPFVPRVSHGSAESAIAKSPWMTLSRRRGARVNTAG